MRRYTSIKYIGALNAPKKPDIKVTRGGSTMLKMTPESGDLNQNSKDRYPNLSRSSSSTITKIFNVERTFDIERKIANSPRILSKKQQIRLDELVKRHKELDSILHNESEPYSKAGVGSIIIIVMTNFVIAPFIPAEDNLYGSVSESIFFQSFFLFPFFYGAISSMEKRSYYQKHKFTIDKIEDLERQIKTYY